MLSNLMREAIEKGAKLFDTHFPGWEHRVSTPQFDSFQMWQQITNTTTDSAAQNALLDKTGYWRSSACQIGLWQWPGGTDEKEDIESGWADAIAQRKR